jgi:hypothetical protein
VIRTDSAHGIKLFVPVTLDNGLFLKNSRLHIGLTVECCVVMYVADREGLEVA